eukprot:TRINITY_DN4085_c0_g1_i2.p1 TRINITY_DN4085_c0_g1~~TRINITY_DN4085_c0_g1_i2.p1  ORF type:complete len:131 (+),score=2.14 TRINITY_DN4085_c0_g1_i2:176-568(+)
MHVQAFCMHAPLTHACMHEFSDEAMGDPFCMHARMYSCMPINGACASLLYIFANFRALPSVILPACMHTCMPLDEGCVSVHYMPLEDACATLLHARLLSTISQILLHACMSQRRRALVHISGDFPPIARG